MIGVEIVADQRTKALGGPERDLIVERAFQRGLLLLGCGPNTIRLCPPLIVTQDETDVAMDIFEECLIEAERRRTGPTGEGEPVGA